MSALGPLQTRGRPAVMSFLESIPDIGSTTNENNSSRLRFATGLQLCFFRPFVENNKSGGDTNQLKISKLLVERVGFEPPRYDYPYKRFSSSMILMLACAVLYLTVPSYWPFRDRPIL